MDKTENRNKPTAVRARHFTHLGFCSYVSSDCIFLCQRQLCGRYDFQNRFLYLRTTIGFVWFRFIYENKTVKDQLVPLICLVLLPNFFCLKIQKYCFRICIRQRTDYYKRLITFIGLILISKPTQEETRF
jgi:hypothetical protein